MKFPIVIAPTYRMGEDLCKMILGINPGDHVMSGYTAARQGLRGYDQPVVILYCEDQPEIWVMDDLVVIHRTLEMSNAVIISLPEVTRVHRPVRSW